jgi:hypothetical protein
VIDPDIRALIRKISQANPLWVTPRIDGEVLRTYLGYYHHTRCHLALARDARAGRAVQGPEQGTVIAIPEVGGLHHRYERRVA